MGKTEIELKQLAKKMGEDRLREAFMRVPFSYGTTGHSGGVVPPSAVTLSIHESARKWESPQYDPGPRRAIVNGSNIQMMDMYYGNGGRLTDRRDPVISDFVLAATGLIGVGTDTWAHKKVSPRLAYIAKFGQSQEGWSSNDPAVATYALAGTTDPVLVIKALEYEDTSNEEFFVLRLGQCAAGDVLVPARIALRATTPPLDACSRSVYNYTVVIMPYCGAPLPAPAPMRLPSGWSPLPFRCRAIPPPTPSPPELFHSHDDVP
jgi:hypothetical protein